MVIIFHWLHLARCLFLACQNQIWQTVFMLGRRQRTCIVCDQWYFLWVWNSLCTQSHDKIPESALCIRLAYLEKKPFCFNWWMNSTIIWGQFCHKCKKPLDSVLKIGTFSEIVCISTDWLKTSMDLWCEM